MKVLLVSAELSPFAKVGGLADVAAALPPALQTLGVEVAVVTPKYRGVADKTDLRQVAEFPVVVGEEELTCTAFQGTIPGSDVPVYFLGHDPYFDRPGIYGEGGEEYPDSLARFVFLSRGVLALCGELELSPAVIHANDWHTALVPVYLAAGEGPPRTGSMLTIHNLAYQGVFPKGQAPLTGLTGQGLSPVERGEQINLLQGGIRKAELLTTVSPTYAREILEQGAGLEGELRRRADSLVGVLNGVDYGVWDPASDPHLWASYSADDPAGKEENKRQLQQELGLTVEARTPLVGMISRLAEQKGFDIVIPTFERMLSLGIQFVVLGTGNPRYEDYFREAARRHPGQVAALITFSESWAHRIEAGCDMFLMPSRFEPCGLNQMYSLRYGTVPVVRATGGLADTVQEYDPARGTGNGFTFQDYDPDSLLAAVRRAVDAYRDHPAAWRELMERGMREDHSWTAAAGDYLACYRRLCQG
ncbi:MAG: glycogen synthase GlgA [Candidatus Bipolaricaulaceae bacterium]